MEEREESISSSSDESQLTIAESPKNKKRGKVKQQGDIELSDEMKSLDKTINDTIAKCKNLTSDVARKMLCKLVKNDHVLALTLLKAEEDDDEGGGRERFQSESSEILSGEDPVTPKFTRLKAKQLNKPLPIPGNLLDTHEPDEEVVKLIQTELKSDSEDEDYQPENEHSDNETNTTFSDIDSQPSTPGSALLNNEEESPFKMPRTPTKTEQENISKRTRSKLCLETTSIQTIESTFVPPDIDYDLYDFNQGFENEDEFEWKDFLSKYNLPLPEDDEKYDEADPEYIATESVPMDKEELRPVRVPKKELNDLISELFEDSSSLFCEPTTFRSKSNESTSKNTKRQKPTPSKGNKYPPPKISSKAYSPVELNTPPHNNEIKNLEATPDQVPKSHYYYSPQLLQTPMKHIQQTPLQSPVPIMYQPQASYPQSPIVPSSPSTILTSPSVLIVNQNQIELRPLADGTGVFNSNSIMNQGYYLNGHLTLPQFQSVVIQVKTLDLLQNGLNFSVQQGIGTESETVENIENLTDDTKKQIKQKSKFSNFHYLMNDDEPKKQLIDETKKGFSYEQNLMFLQQMQIHAQILAVNYLQFYAHPFWWHLAESNKENLQQLQTIFKSSHIQNCLELCESWEKELEESTDSNKKYMEFLQAEMEIDQRCFQDKRPFKGKFHNMLMEKVLRSKAILYPSLLPHCPMRSIKFVRVSAINSELSLLALAYEHAYDSLFKEMNSYNLLRVRIPQLHSIVSAIIRITGTFRSEQSVTKLFEKYKAHKEMNPIKYYFIHKQAPAIKHEIIDFSKESLPDIWEKYKFSQQRLVVNETLRKGEFFISADVNYQIEEDSNSSSSQATISEVVELNESLKLEIIKNTDAPQIVISYLHKDTQIEKTPDSPERNPLKVLQKTKEDKEKNLTSILKKVKNCVENSPPKKKSVNFDLPSETPQKPQKILRGTLSNKFQATLEKFFKEYSNNVTSSQQLIRLVFLRFRSFDIYWRLVDASRMFSKKNKNEGSNGTSNESGVKNRKHITSEEYSKRINRKLADNRALIMQKAKNENSTEKDCSYAHNYLEKVKRTLVESGDENLYTDFMKVLTAFNPEVESVPELYYKMENLLMPNYSDLLDLFLTFLLPEHASEIGKFCEHFLLTKMAELVQHLNLYFQKQPSHMKKIYSCLNELSNDQDLTIEKLKLKILPLLKGNQLLIEWFMGIFETPSDNMDDYETLHLKKPLGEGEICDYTYEELQSQDVIEGDSNSFSSCGVKYINGKIMYRCKTLLPAKISFLVSEVNVEKSPASKEDDCSNWCVHEIRKHVQFSDKRKNNENGDQHIDARTVKTKKSSKRFKVCDAQTLHAHAVRLNPIHAQVGEKVSDALQVLNSQTVSTSQDSPKKQLNKTKKGSPKKNINKSPSTSSETSSNNQSPSPSKALQTAKKLRSIIDDSHDEQPQQIKKFKIDSSSEDSEISSINIEEVPEPAIVEAWTRDEDKIILEEIRGGKSNKDESINNLIKSLNRRSHKEIKDRYEFLLNLLAQIAEN